MNFDEDLLKQLVKNVTQLDIDHKYFPLFEKHAVDVLNSAVFSRPLIKREIHTTLQGLAEKFSIRGYPNASKYLSTYSEQFLESGCRSSLDHTRTRLALLELLLRLSESPLKRFEENGDFAKTPYEAELIDWPALLNNSHHEYVPLNSTLEDTDSEIYDHEDNIKNQEEENLEVEQSVQIESTKAEKKTALGNDQTDGPISKSIYKSNLAYYKKFIKENVQHSWWDQLSEISNFTLENKSPAFLWDDVINKCTGGLIYYQTETVTEYKILRELISAFFVPFDGFIIKIENKKRTIRNNRSIPSLTAPTIKQFLETLCETINQLQELYDFSQKVNTNFPLTYKEYQYSIYNIISPVYKFMSSYESSVRKQEQVHTLFEMKMIVSPITNLISSIYILHKKFTQNLQPDDPPHVVSSKLICDVYNTMSIASTTMMFCLTTSIFLHIIATYLNIIDTWLTHGLMDDPCEEFVIDNKHKEVRFNQKLHQVVNLREVSQEIKENAVIKVIHTKVLNIGMAVQVLSRLNRIQKYQDSSLKSNESLYDEFLRSVLNELIRSSGTEHALFMPSCGVPFNEHNSYLLKQNLFSSKRKSSMECAANILSSEPDYMMLAFENLFEEEKLLKYEHPSLYSSIYEVCKSIVSPHKFITNILCNIIRKRFSSAAYIVKEILFNEFELQKHYDFIQRIYLFKTSQLSLWYEHLFVLMDNNEAWHPFYVTTRLQNILMDDFPKFCEYITVIIKHDWRKKSNPFDSLCVLELEYLISWPATLVVDKELIDNYKVIFHFILKIKYSLWILNHMNIKELQLAVLPTNLYTAHLVKRLQLFKFSFLNTITWIHEFLFSYVFEYPKKYFLKPNENDSNDLSTLYSTHLMYSKSISTCIMKLQEENVGMNQLLDLTLDLKNIWSLGCKYKLKDLEDIEKKFIKFDKNVKAMVELITKE